jgi:alanine racemase
MNTTVSRCWVEIDLAALRRNATVARERVGPGVELLAVVKADGYGHGMTAVAQALAMDAQLFGVANLGEATQLRESVAHPIMILGPALPEERESIVRQQFIPSVSNLDETIAFDRTAEKTAIAINFVIDTGMGRMGTIAADGLKTIGQIATLQNTKLHSISTHLPVADENEEFTRRQLSDFTGLVRRIRTAVPGDYKVHVLLSAGVLGFFETAFDIVRVGLMLYGSSPLPQFQNLLVPVMTLKARVVLVRDLPAGSSVSYGRTFVAPNAMRVATLGAGYADGYPRSLSGRGAWVLIGGKRCPLLGRVTMDLMMVDVSGLPDVKVGDEAVLFGRQAGEEILASEIAERAGTIAWEIFTGIGSRVRRVYL